MPPRFKLYSFYTSSCSYRVRIALAHKGIDYEYIPINLGANEQKSEAFTRKSPAQLVPLLLAVDGQKEMLVSESTAIIEYLDEVAPGPLLLPGDALNRARIRQISAEICSGIQPLQNQSVLKAVKEKLGKAAMVPWAQQFIHKGFATLEQQLQGVAGTYCVGDELTMADCCLVPQVFNATHKYSVDIAGYPTIARVTNNCLNHPAVKAAHPDNQPDAPNKTHL